MKGSATILAAPAGILPAADGARLRHQPVESNQRAGRRQDAGSNGLEARAPLPLTADSLLITPRTKRHREFFCPNPTATRKNHAPIFAGTFTALATPFKNDQIDEAAFAALIEAQIAAGITGIVPVGTTGESPTLDDEALGVSVQK